MMETAPPCGAATRRRGRSSRADGGYRLLVPRVSFLGFFLLEPRGAVRAALGAAFLRAARFSAFRSSVLSILVVFAMGVFSILCGRP